MSSPRTKVVLIADPELGMQLVRYASTYDWAIEEYPDTYRVTEVDSELVERLCKIERDRSIIQRELADIFDRL